MLDLINRYAHGYVIVPMMDVCSRRGVFDALRVAPQTVDELAHSTGANLGGLSIGLRSMVSLGWVQRDREGKFALSTKSELRRCIPSRSREFLDHSIAAHLSAEGGDVIAWWIDRSLSKWDVGEDHFADLMDGVFLIPLLLELRRSDFFSRYAADISISDEVDSRAGSVHARVREHLDKYFLVREWTEIRDGRQVFTRTGQFLTGRIFSTATVMSYRPLLARIDDVLFGDPSALFAKNSNGFEGHVDRRLNVQGSGFQHKKYFNDIEATLTTIFNTPDIEAQPRYIADTGCGDGSLLRRIFEIVRSKTTRGEKFAEYPLSLIGIDYNRAALAEAGATLAAYPHILLEGDIGDPDRIVSDLRKRGIESSEVLHVRSFLDHDRPLQLPEEEAPDAGFQLHYEGVYIDRNGKSISPPVIYQSLVEHLRRWKHVCNSHGLLLLEVHNQKAEAAGAFLDESESVHFDAYHALSTQYLVEAPAFIMAAASQGLIPDPNHARRYPKTLPFTRITANRFRPQDYAIRHIQLRDWSHLEALIPGNPSANLALQISERMACWEGFPEGQFVLVRGETILAALFARRAEKNLRGHGNDLRQGYLVDISFLDTAHESADHADELFQFARYVLATMSSVQSVRDLRRSSAARSTIHTKVVDRISAETVRAADRELVGYAVRVLATHLTSVGAIPAEDETCTLEDMIDVIELAPKYYRLFDAFMGMLEEVGAIQLAGEEIRRGDNLPQMLISDLSRQRERFERELLDQNPGAAALFRLAQRCLDALPALLAGRESANDIVFPEGDVNAFANLFLGEPVADYFNGLIADFALKAAKELLANGRQGPFRICEIGAGTGGTSTLVLNAFAEAGLDVAFHYTDISPFFVRLGERQFSRRYPGMTFQVLDIETPSSVAASGLGAFDMVTATQVLHNTEYLRHTLRQIGRLLRKGGQIVINEFTEQKDALLFSGGWLPGFWTAEDRHLRFKRSCLASAEQWCASLVSAGFSDAESIGLPDTAGGSSPQSIIVARFEAASDLLRAVSDANIRVPFPNSPVDQSDIGTPDEIVVAALAKVIGPERVSGAGANTPFPEIGIDSMELLEFRIALEASFSRRLASTFLFRYHTVAAVARALAHEEGGRESATQPGVPGTPEEARQEGLITEIADEASGEERYPQASFAQGIAVVGVSCRFPNGIESPEEFWALLVEMGSVLGRVPTGRWSNTSVDKLAKRFPGIDRGSFFENIESFDPSFFRISAREARFIDPQQRMLLELSWHTLEDAGIDPSALAGSKTGVFIGACRNDYRDIMVDSGEENIGPYFVHGSMASATPNRISHFYDLNGPSLSVDAACASSLVALLHAADSIRKGECNLALVGAANVICTPTDSVSYLNAGLQSKAGICRSFHPDGDGFVRGEGGAMVLLMPLEKALTEHRAVYGVIRGGAVMHSGRGSTYAAPRPDAQAAVVRAALDNAGVDPSAISYVEAQAVGGGVTDIAEIEALGEVLGTNQPGRRKGATVYVGSVEPNIGHLEAASGLASVLKVLLALRHGEIPQLHGESRPDVLPKDSRLSLVTEKRPWESADVPRCAGVSSFGMGGVLAHLIIEEGPRPAGVVN